MVSLKYFLPLAFFRFCRAVTGTLDGLRDSETRLNELRIIRITPETPA
jgi:hypothetical protein